MESYTIYTGQFEKGTPEQQAVFVRLFGVADTQCRFDFYFHWYNILHEYGHCLCSHCDSAVLGLEQEMLVNHFAVGLWAYAGYEKELQLLRTMLDGILARLPDPVPTELSFMAYYRQIWGTERLMEVPVYGYLQFQSVRLALEKRERLEDTLREMGIRIRLAGCPVPRRDYAISAAAAKEVLKDARRLLDRLGVGQPAAEVMLVDDPSVHCVKYQT